MLKAKAEKRGIIEAGARTGEEEVLEGENWRREEAKARLGVLMEAM